MALNYSFDVRIGLTKKFFVKINIDYIFQENNSLWKEQNETSIDNVFERKIDKKIKYMYNTI